MSQMSKMYQVCQVCQLYQVRDTCEKPARKLQPFAPVLGLAIFFKTPFTLNVKT